ncbi:MAG: hypothetical protein U5L74_13800 [Ideonella sp.]|nr:hypothetical protein [Ideonella sp.]
MMEDSSQAVSSASLQEAPRGDKGRERWDGTNAIGMGGLTGTNRQALPAAPMLPGADFTHHRHEAGASSCIGDQGAGNRGAQHLLAGLAATMGIRPECRQA